MGIANHNRSIQSISKPPTPSTPKIETKKTRTREEDPISTNYETKNNEDIQYLKKSNPKLNLIQNETKKRSNIAIPKSI